MSSLRAAVLTAAACGVVGLPRPIAAQTSTDRPGAASFDSTRTAIETAMAAADWATIERMVGRLRQQANAAPRDPWRQYDLAYALHRRASAMIVEDRARDARTLLEEAIAAAQRSQALGGGGHAIALEGAVTGQLAGVVGGLSVMRLGPRSFRLLDQAIDTLPNDPRAALLNGISRLNAPRAFGGGAAKGEAELRRAIRLFATDANRSPLPTWGLVDAHIWLGIALREQDRPAEARAEWQRALALAPGHRWVTDQLLPSVAAR